jgi:hypothetical protein
VEVIEQKSSVASSDEERLAAGISTIGLQAKRLYVGQRKRLTRERKMMEGTWTEKKPPRKTPSPQDKGAVGSSGGVKRPHSDSSTSSLEKQQPKKPRNTQGQTGSYKEDVTGIKMAIIHRHPEVKLDQTQVEMIQAKLLTAVDETPLGETPPQFLYSQFTQGIFWITCANEPSKAWLMRTISGLGEIWEGAELTVVDSKDLPKRPRVLDRIPNTSQVAAIMTCLRIQNSEFNTTDLSVMSRKVTEREQTLALSIDPDPFEVLTRLNFKAFWGLGRIIFRTLKDDKRDPEAESTTSKSPPQYGGLGCPLYCYEELRCCPHTGTGKKLLKFN